jgi:DNA primase
LSTVKEVFPQINETLEAVVLDNSMKTLLKIPVSDIVKKLDTAEGGKILVMDGIITQRLIDAADKVGIEYIVGHRTGELKKSTDINIITFSQMGVGN